MFCMPLSMHQRVVRPVVRDNMFPRYLHCPFIDFRQTFVVGAFWDKDELIGF